MKFNYLYIIQFLVFIFIILLAVYIESEYLWLIIVIYLLFKTKLIDKNELCFLNDIRKAWNGQYNTEPVTNKEKREIYENITSENSIQKSNKKEFLKDYKNIFTKTINWFKYIRNIQFETEKKLKFSNGKIIYPDGILETENNDTILEFKMGSANSNAIKEQILAFNRYQDYYDCINKNSDFYFALLVKNKIEIPNIIEIIEHSNISNLNLNILFFQEQNNNLELLREVTYKNKKSK